MDNSLYWVRKQPLVHRQRITLSVDCFSSAFEEVWHLSKDVLQMVEI